jgi:oligopeptidase A
MDCLLPLFSGTIQAFKLLITDKSEVAGLSANTLALAAQNAAADGYTAATADSGPWLLKLDSNTYSAVMSSAHNRELRQKMYVAEKTAASSGEYDNSQLVKDILKLRQQLAGLLGYKSWGEYRATSKVSSATTAGCYVRRIRCLHEHGSPAMLHTSRFLFKLVWPHMACKLWCAKSWQLTS